MKYFITLSHFSHLVPLRGLFMLLWVGRKLCFPRENHPTLWILPIITLVNTTAASNALAIKIHCNKRGHSGQTLELVYGLLGNGSVSHSGSMFQFGGSSPWYLHNGCNDLPAHEECAGCLFLHVCTNNCHTCTFHYTSCRWRLPWFALHFHMASGVMHFSDTCWLFAYFYNNVHVPLLFIFKCHYLCPLLRFVTSLCVLDINPLANM